MNRNELEQLSNEELLGDRLDIEVIEEIESRVEAYREELESKDLYELIGDHAYEELMEDAILVEVESYEQELTDMPDAELLGEERIAELREQAIQEALEKEPVHDWQQQGF